MLTRLVPKPGRLRGALAEHDFRWLWFGRASSWLGNSMSLVAMPLVAVQVLHTGTFVVGLLQALSTLPWLVIGLPAGAWADRLNKRPVLLACDAMAFLLFLSVPVAAWCGVLTVAQLLAVALLAGVAGVFFTAAYAPYLPFLVDKEHLPNANATMQSTWTLSQVVGPGVGGTVSQALGPVFGVLGNALSFAVSAMAFLRVRKSEPKPVVEARAKPSLAAEIREGVRFIVKDPYLRIMILFAGVANYGDAMMQAVVIVFLVRGVGLLGGPAGVLVAVMSLGGVIGAALASRVGKRLGTARGMLLSIVGTSPFVLLLPLTRSGGGVLYFAIGGCVYWIGTMASNVLIATFEQSYIPQRMRGRTTSVMMLLAQAAVPLGALSGATLGEAYGPRTTLWISGVLITLSSGLFFIGPIARRRDLPTVSPPPTVGQLII